MESPKVLESTNQNLFVSDISYDKSTRTISFKTNNKGITELNTGLFYSIEKYDKEGGWTKTDLTDSLVFIEIALIIEPDKTINEKIDLSQIQPLKNGCYRIVKQYNDEENTIIQYIQFKVNDDELFNFYTYNS
ncbi:MAG: immunoglobulin-like domain-containing protein [Peptostreptococcaceae bacterium]|nr:immunoglobulin-like domain-containing protein [Peptostreptococcaceae bacterium]